MKILFLGTQMTVGGAQLTLLKLAAGFHERQHQVAAMFLYDKDGLERIWQTHYPFPVMSIGAWDPKGGFRRLWLLMKGLIQLLMYLSRQRFDILISFTQHSNLLAMPLAWLCRIRGRIASNRGRIENIPLWMEKLHGKLVNSRLTTCLVVNSPLLIKQAVEIEGANPQKIQLIYNGIAEIFLQADAFRQQRHAIRKELGLEGSEIVLISVGRLTHQKGHRYLLQAMPDIIACHPSTKLILVGDGPLRGELAGLTADLGLQHAVFFLGTRNDVPQLLAAADVFVLPSISEGMPNALLEAMAFGLPCVISDLDAVQGIIHHGQQGLLVPMADSTAISEAVCQLIKDETLCKELGLQAKKLIHEQFSFQKMIDQYEQLFYRVLDQRG